MAKSGLHIPPQVLAAQKQLIGMQKTVFDNTYKALVSFQEQQQQMLERSLAQLPQMPAEARELLATWQRAAGEGQRHFKRAVDQSFDALQDYLDGLSSGSAPAGQARKPAAKKAAPKKAAKKPATKKAAPKKRAAKKKSAAKKKPARKS